MITLWTCLTLRTRAFATLLVCGMSSLVMASSTYADLIFVGLSSNSLQMSEGTTQRLSVNVRNNVDTDPDEDQIASWMLRLRLVPDAGSTGTLTLQIPAGNGIADDPTNYLFDGTATDGIAITNFTSVGFLASDATQSLGGFQLTTNPANLLTMTLSASPDASGTFGVMVLGGAADSKWTKADGAPLAFDNVGFNALTRLGTISVVPEPSAFILVGFVGILSVRLCRRRNVVTHINIDRK